MHTANLSRIAGKREAISAAAERFDRFELILGIELAPQATDEYFDNVAIPFEVLIVQTLRQLRLRNNFPGAQHQMREDAVFEGCELHGPTIYRDTLRAGIQ